jgi:hypothetical protein
MFSPVESWRTLTIAVNVFHVAEAFVSSSATQDIACAKKYHHGSAKWSRQSVDLAPFLSHLLLALKWVNTWMQQELKEYHRAAAAASGTSGSHAETCRVSLG